MAKKQGGMNTKVEAANAKKAAAKASKDAAKAKAAAAAAAESAEWSKGADARGDRRRQEEERKRTEAEAKKAEKQKLLALEEHALDEDKRVIRKQKKAVKEVAKPWEEALKPAGAKKSNRGSKKPSAFAAGPSGGKLTQADMAALSEAEEARTAAKPGRKAIKFDNNFQANKNRNQDEDGEARSLDAALDLLTVSDKEMEKHPERRAKAAYKAFEEVMMPQLREDYPGLKLSQYKQKLSELWRRSPDNPLNQESLAYNAKKL
ncbi:hypothetical protein PF008_g29611 [Phytophthora fragariae]|uniref:HMG box domain-containing protein n=1 Tax=Phytophthora fragariae TaxID=53985 RepID=A0A6G0Q7X0_9STRA|nr:hypothetical protein PF008_g29611 [Phytophthora fragariae]